MTICARLNPTWAMMTSISPRPGDHHLWEEGELTASAGVMGRA
jgi:hypothetical protein